jgi:hypothetical protein
MGAGISGAGTALRTKKIIEIVFPQQSCQPSKGNPKWVAEPVENEP